MTRPPRLGGQGRRALTRTALFFLLACAAIAWYVWSPRLHAPASMPARVTGGAAPATAAFVGETACAKCHEPQTKDWRASDHARAMELPTDQSVLGDFSGSTFSHSGVASTFFRRDGKFMVRTDGPDGALHDYEVKYTFGYRPLQQYLIEFPGGRLQCLGIAWDTRPKAQGGQRWFHLYPNERIPAGDVLHWTGPNQNWNYMCADCHSTNLRRNYDLASNSYKTTWSEINVSCETCHGPGSTHVAWAEDRKRRGLTGRDSSSMGLVVQGLRAMDYSGFGVGDATRVVARLADRPRQRAEIQACAPCHSRRSPILTVPDYGATYLDNYRPALLTEGLYHPDGQILEEDYEYASFTQSRMYQAGVTCSDCHNAHSLKQRGTGNNVCLHCHLPLTYDTPSHHHHKQGTDAALCRNCHMRTTTYMVVDPRYDHSMRVPRVDYSIKYGVPNACTTPCHSDKSLAWANDAVIRWYGPTRTRGNDYVGAFTAARRSAPDAERQLREVVLNPQYSSIARATALEGLGPLLSPASIDALYAGIGGTDAILRVAAARALEYSPDGDRWRLGSGLLDDPVRLVRATAAVSLAGTPRDMLTPDQAVALEKGIEEAVALESAVAERPEAHLNLSSLHARRGRLQDAEAELRIALRLDPRNVPALVNYADLCRATGREAEAEQHLKAALAVMPNAAEVVYALGLLYVRTGRSAEAVGQLRHAHELQPTDVTFAYGYAAGLDSQGKTGEAIRVLAEVQRARPGDRNVLTALAAYEEKRGDWSAAIGWAQKLLDVRPDDTEAKAAFQNLRQRAAATRQGGRRK
jgi:tetratricopeptide (TPR) repeat protein